MLEQLVQSEAAERSRRSLEQRLRLSGIKSFKPMADFDWAWPKKIERDVIERALTLDFLQEGRNLVLVGCNGLGKTMMARLPLVGHEGGRKRSAKTWSFR
jgi:DNA replication protein DnaC